MPITQSSTEILFPLSFKEFAGGRELTVRLADKNLERSYQMLAHQQAVMGHRQLLI